MNKTELTFSAILVPLDYLMIVLTGLTVYALRFGPLVTDILPVVYQLPLREYSKIVLIVAVFWLIIFALGGLYSIKGTTRTIDEIGRIFLACSTAVLIIIVLIFFRREFFSSRFIILSSWLLSIIYISIARLIVRYIQKLFFKKGIGVHQVVIIGRDENTEEVSRQIYRKKTLGYKIINRFKNFDEETRNKLKEEIKIKPIDEIIQADPSLPQNEVLNLVDFCNENHIVFKYTPNLFEAQATNIEVNTLDGIPIIEIKRTPLDGWGKIIKRLFDIIGSIFLIILTSPIMLITTMAIKLDSAGPILFRYRDDGQKLKRVEQHGKMFNYFKFRSMFPKTDSLRYSKELAQANIRKGTPMVKIRNDPRVTKVGRFIRRFSIDELPEFFLVLLGKMSLVGPRPHLPEEVAQYKKHHKKILTIKPGVTGLAQIAGRSDLNFEDEARLDNYYIENWSLKLDLIILFKTPLAVLRKRKAV